MAKNKTSRNTDFISPNADRAKRENKSSNAADVRASARKTRSESQTPPTSPTRLASKTQDANARREPESISAKRRRAPLAPTLRTQTNADARTKILGEEGVSTPRRADENNAAPRKPSAPIDENTKTLDVPGVVSIPLSEIEITYARSSGPGGQNVNKVSSKARLRWNLYSGRLDADVVARFKELYPSWVTENGEVVVSSQISRDAPKNKYACLEKLRQAIKKAAFKPKKRIPTKPTRGSVLRRLDSKKRESLKKQERSRRDFD